MHIFPNPVTNYDLAAVTIASTGPTGGEIIHYCNNKGYCIAT